jgi:hypothetical protein
MVAEGIKSGVTHTRDMLFWHWVSLLLHDRCLIDIIQQSLTVLCPLVTLIVTGQAAAFVPFVPFHHLRPKSTCTLR